MELYLIAAVAENDVIGRDGEIPWEDRDYAIRDIRHFVELTTGDAVIMGRKTYDTLRKKPLPKRYNIVLTGQPKRIEEEGVAPVTSVGDALHEAHRFAEERDREKSWVIGGESVYEQTIGVADGLEITEIHEKFEGDTHFPEIDPGVWRETEREKHGEMDFVSYRRR